MAAPGFRVAVLGCENDDGSEAFEKANEYIGPSYRLLASQTLDVSIHM